MTDMREQLINAMSDANIDDIVSASMDDFEEKDGHSNHLRGFYADAIIAALPSMVAPPVFGTPRRQKQLVEHNPGAGHFGDCYRTCVAIILGEHPSCVPHVCERGTKNIDGLDGLIAMRQYLRGRGLAIAKSVYHGNLSWAGVRGWIGQFNPDSFLILTGARTTGTNHCIVMKGGDVFCDPITGTAHDNALSGPAVSDGESNWWVEIIHPIAPEQSTSDSNGLAEWVDHHSPRSQRKGPPKRGQFGRVIED